MWLRLSAAAVVGLALWAQIPTASLPVLGQTFAPSGSQLHAQVRALAQTGARVEEIELQPGASLRAYVSASGRVFGLAWQSPALPNMAHLLGGYFAAFQAAARQAPRRAPLYIHTDSLVVEMSGHQRDFRGRAYLADAIPSGLTPAVVQ